MIELQQSTKKMGHEDRTMDLEENEQNLRCEGEARLAECAARQSRSRLENGSRDDLLYELKGHQVEFELQDMERDSLYHKLYRTIERLDVANEDLRRVENELRNVYGLLPVACFTLNGKGIVREVNPAGASLLRAEINEVQGAPLARFCSRPDADKLYRYLLKLKDTDGQKECELAFHRATGATIKVLLQGYQRSDRDEIHVAAIHLTERKRVERGEAWFSTLVNASDEAIIGLDANSRITSWNPGATSIFGFRSEETLYCPVTDLIDPTIPGGSTALTNAICEGRHWRAPYQTARGKDNRELGIALTLSPVFHGGELHGFVLVARDVTKLRQIEMEVLSIAEREQRRFGRDLHDSLGQRLVGARLAMERLAKRLRGSSPELVTEMEKVNGTLSEAVQEARAMAHGSALLYLETSGLYGALKKLAEQMERCSQVSVCCQVEEAGAVQDLEVGTHLYRIAQEAIKNAVTHGRARQIELCFTAMDEHYQLVVRDDGIGMERGEGYESDGMGMRSMRYRANMMNGSLELQNCREGGTAVTCIVPR